MTCFIQHAANVDRSIPPGSLSALEKSLNNGIGWVEVDIIPLREGDFVLLHDPKLENVSNGYGDAFERTSQEIQKLTHLPVNGVGREYHLGTLSQAIQLMIESGKSSFLQLDLKPYAPLSMDVLKNLLSMIEPVKERIMVSCVADWAIRLLRKMDSAIMLGFDPLLYLDIVGTEPRPEGIPPFRLGAFGYLDDHPLAAQKWGKLGEYFALRAEALLYQVPKGTTWFINANLLCEVLDAGFNWIKTLKENGSKVDAWTIDIDRKIMATRLVAEDIDFITSNDSVLLERELI